MRALVAVLATAALARASSAVPPRLAFSSATGEADRVALLPGQTEGHDAGLYAGYVTVDEAAGRALFYVLEAASSPLTAPVTLWLNGGPGCSSLGGGWLSELGTVIPTPGGGLELNPYAWSRHSHVVYLESPAFVGFSYSNTSADAVVGDARTAADSRRFILGLLAKFPGLGLSDFYIAGESYAGHYIPTLAAAILEGNAAGKDPHINLQGIMIGNAWTHPAADNKGAATHWWSHNHISTPTYKAMLKNCDFATFGPISALSPSFRGTLAAPSAGSSPQDACDAACAAAMDEMGATNIYDLYADVCPGPASAPSPSRRGGAGVQLAKLLARGGAASPAGARAAPSSAAARALLSGAARPSLRPLAVASLSSASPLPRDSSAPPTHDGSGFPMIDPCIDDEVTTYLNREDVRSALHVLPGSAAWATCTDAIEYSYDDLLTSMLPVHRALIAAKLRILIYSGDTDGIVPTAGTRDWVEGLGLPEVSSWKPWSAVSADHMGPQVGGYSVQYEGLTFATVRGAGHMVPTTQPGRALHLFKRFLDNVPL